MLGLQGIVAKCTVAILWWIEPREMSWPRDVPKQKRSRLVNKLIQLFCPVYPKSLFSSEISAYDKLF